MADAPPPGPPPPKVPEGWKAVWNSQYSEWYACNALAHSIPFHRFTSLLILLPVAPTNHVGPGSLSTSTQKPPSGKSLLPLLPTPTTPHTHHPPTPPQASTSPLSTRRAKNLTQTTPTTLAHSRQTISTPTPATPPSFKPKKMPAPPPQDHPTHRTAARQTPTMAAAHHIVHNRHSRSSSTSSRSRSVASSTA